MIFLLRPRRPSNAKQQIGGRWWAEVGSATGHVTDVLPTVLYDTGANIGFSLKFNFSLLFDSFSYVLRTDYHKFAVVSVLNCMRKGVIRPSGNVVVLNTIPRLMK